MQRSDELRAATAAFTRVDSRTGAGMAGLSSYDGQFPSTVSTPRLVRAEDAAPLHFPDQRPDSLLIALAARGDKDAFSALYRRHRGYVGRVAQRFTGDTNESLDVTQETFICLYRKVPTLKLTAKLTTYLYPIVKNIALSRRRKQRGRTLLAEDDREAGGGAVDPRAAAPGGGPRPIEVAVAKLPEGQREVLLMRFVDDMQMREIASALNIPIGTVKSRLFEAVRNLRAQEGIEELFVEE